VYSRAGDVGRFPFVPIDDFRRADVEGLLDGLSGEDDDFRLPLVDLPRLDAGMFEVWGPFEKCFWHISTKSAFFR
jgi:hypothetical protein